MSTTKRGPYKKYTRRFTNEPRCEHGHTRREHPRCFEDNEYKPKENAKILLLDVETTPINAFIWGLWDQTISIDAIIQDWHFICWSAKWIFTTEILTDCLTSEEAKNHDDIRVSKSLWELLNQADIVVSHNGNKFDLKRMNTRFLYHNMLPPTEYKTIDTLKIAREQFSFTSNKLDYINKFLGLQEKTETGYDLWRRCFYGDEKALHEMQRYNMNDVSILEDLYLYLRPYIKGHPNLNLWSVESISICPNCGSKELIWKGNYYTNTLRYSAFRCTDCGAVGRAKTNNLSKEKRATIVKS